MKKKGKNKRGKKIYRQRYKESRYDKRHVIVKNGHILPTGQWYALSAVNNDALIMPGYARACQSMPE